MNHRPVGRRIERSDVKRQELGLWVHIHLRGSPTAWNIGCHLKGSVKMAENVETGREYEKSTKKVNPGRVKNGRKGRGAEKAQ